MTGCGPLNARPVHPQAPEGGKEAAGDWMIERHAHLHQEKCGNIMKYHEIS